ncbi:unnamed protein product, partial [Prorocentrum cordatum]
ARRARAALAAAARGRGARRAPLVLDVVDAEVVDVEEGEEEAATDDGSTLIADILARFETSVQVRSLLMEYAREPKRSALSASGFPELEMGGPVAAAALVGQLRKRGLGPDQAEVGAAVLCLMMGALDEAHNLVTPHTENKPTTFGGPPRFGSTAVQEACYCQVLVHRMEGEHRGSSGTGFAQSDHWISRAFPSYNKDAEHPVHTALRLAAQEWGSTACPDMARGFLRSTSARWSPKGFNQLCADALEDEDPELLEFCGRLQAKELRLLFDGLAASEPAQSRKADRLGGSFGPAAAPAVEAVARQEEKSTAGQQGPGTDSPEFKKIMQDLGDNPQVIQNMAQSDPKFKEMLEKDPELKKVTAFRDGAQAFGKAFAAMAGAGGATPDGNEQLSEDDDAAVERLRLCDLSRPKEIIAQVYVACGRDEKKASEILLNKL